MQPTEKHYIENQYIVSYALDYQHCVNICVRAQGAELAMAVVQERFDNGTLWDTGNPDCYLVYDDFEEVCDNVLCFEARQHCQDIAPT